MLTTFQKTYIHTKHTTLPQKFGAVSYAVGEACLINWRSNRFRYITCRNYFNILKELKLKREKLFEIDTKMSLSTQFMLYYQA